MTAGRPPVSTERIIALVAIVAVGATYYGSWTLGLWWDDYVALRPWSLSEVARAFVGPWDRWGVWPLFYRPLSVAWYALSFELFGLHAWPTHIVSIIGLMTTAGLTGLFVWRETHERLAAVFAAALYAAHPAVALAQGPWLYLQNHLLCSLIVAATLLSWQKRRGETGARPLWVLGGWALLGFLVQEDMIMLGPMWLGLQLVRAWMVCDVAAPTRRQSVATLTIMLILFAGRSLILGELGGPPLPSLAGMAANVLRGPAHVFLVLAIPATGLTWLACAGLGATMLGGLWAVLRAGRTPLSGVFVSGVWIVACFATPLAFASSWSRYHLLGLGSVLSLSAALGLWRRRLHVSRGWWALAGGTILAVSLALVARTHAMRQPCSESMLWSDSNVLSEWITVPAHLKQWIAAKPAACALGEVDQVTRSVDVITWILDEPINSVDHGNLEGGAGTRVVALVTRQARALALEVRAEAFEGPMPLTVTSNGTALTAMTVTTAWQSIEVPLSSGWRTSLRDMHRVDITIVNRTGEARVDVRRLRAVR